MHYKGIIFDLDGTLANTLEDIAGSMNRILLAHGYPLHHVNDFKLLVGRGLDNLVKQALPPKAREPETIAVCLAEMIADYDIHCLVKTDLYEGIRELIHKLLANKIKLAVFSNKSEPLTLKIVGTLLSGVPFVKVAGARSDVPKKPDPTGALLISRQMEVTPAKILYVGDSDVDMITATRAGMVAVGVSWGFRSREELIDNGAIRIVDKPEEIAGLIEAN